MLSKPIVYSLAGAALALASCAGIPRQPARQDVATQAARPAGIPTITAPPSAAALPAQSPTTSDLNRKLLGQSALTEEEGDLPLGPGDLIEVAVFEVQEFQGLKLRIPNSGQIALPLIGTLNAAGHTAVDLQNEVRARLQEKYVHDPQVTLFVHEHKSQRISVIGAVRSGGVFTLTSRLRLADALALAGGLTEEAGPTVYVVRWVPAALVSGSAANGATEQVMTAVNLGTLVAGKDELNLPLQSGDVIDVPRAGSYYVGGEVNRPGSFPLKARTTVAQTPHAAGGVKDAADWDDVRLYRTSPQGTREVQRYSLNDFESGKPAPELQAGDIVIVGKSNVKAFLYGVRDFFRFGIGASVPIVP
jgi:polysaccharide export outer membrane protein